MCLHIKYYYQVTSLAVAFKSKGYFPQKISVLILQCSFIISLNYKDQCTWHEITSFIVTFHCTNSSIQYY